MSSSVSSAALAEGKLSRRAFIGAVGAGAAALALPAQGDAATSLPEFRGRNVVMIRFGGGTRRRESIDPQHTFAPFLVHELARQGVMFPRMEIAQQEGLNTSHGEGTLNLLTGRYDRYQDVQDGFLKSRFEPKVPTLFEYLRRAADVQPHETLLVNGEDRPDEEFYTFSNHAGFGIDFRAGVLSLYRYKRWRLERDLAEGKLDERATKERLHQLSKWEQSDPRGTARQPQGDRFDVFWERWQEHYGGSGLVNPRGDRLLTTLARRALQELRPRLLMVNYNDCDYVHWGYLSHYTTGISIMDEGLRELWTAVQNDPFYRGNTVFVVVPDCGRDTNPLASVPCQHHFNSRSSREIFAFLAGPDIPRGQVVNRVVQQVDVAPTLGRFLGVPVAHAEGAVLSEAFA